MITKTGKLRNMGKNLQNWIINNQKSGKLIKIDQDS